MASARCAGLLVLAASMSLLWTAQAAAQSRIKDIVDFEGVRDNMLIGYGLVVGLNGTGDNLDNAEIGRHTSELQSLMRISYAVFCLKKKNTQTSEVRTNHRTQDNNEPFIY